MTSSPPGRRCAAVTGATGFLGRHLVRELQAQGWRVRALVRRDPEPWGGGTPELVRGDLADPAALRRLCDGADAVLHLAGRIKARRAADFHAANVDGARAAAEATREAAPAAAFVLVSSLAAREPALSPYAASKARGEAAVRAVLPQAATVRPPLIYGPGDRETLPLFRGAAAGVLPWFNRRGRLAVIHAADAARALASSASGRLAGRTVALSDAHPEGYGWRDLLEAAARAVGSRAAVIPAPEMLVHAAGGLGDLAAAFGAEPFLTSGKAREALHRDWSVAPAERDTDAPPPRLDLAAGFADTVAWARAAGRLPPAAR